MGKFYIEIIETVKDGYGQYTIDRETYSQNFWVEDINKVVATLTAEIARQSPTPEHKVKEER